MTDEITTEITHEITNNDKKAKIVEVKFSKYGKSFTRNINSVFDENGKFDKAATDERIEQVKQGLVHKLAVGAITFE